MTVPIMLRIPSQMPHAAMAAPRSLPAAAAICDRATAPKTMARIEPTNGTTGTRPRTSEAMAIPLIRVGSGTTSGGHQLPSTTPEGG
jgi:hypothetical protein